MELSRVRLSRIHGSGPPTAAARQYWNVMTCSLYFPSDSKEQSPLAPQRAHPPDLCEPALERPIVGGAREQILGDVVEDRAGIGSEVLDAMVREPALDFGDRVTMLLRM